MRWLGVYFNTQLGSQVIPAYKVTEAMAVPGSLLTAKPVVFGSYRPLMRRIRHFRGIAETGRTLQCHMYVPSVNGELRPRGRADATPGVLERAGEWRAQLLKCPVQTCARFVADHVRAVPQTLADVQWAFHAVKLSRCVGAVGFVCVLFSSV